MKLNQIAAQLYTLRGLIETEAQIAAALRRVKAMGYDAVQVSGLGHIDDHALARMLDGEGLVCCATHEPAEIILTHPEAVIERLQILSCRFTAYPYPSGVDFGDFNAVRFLAENLNNAGQQLHEAGKTLCYHNHQIEFRKIDGSCILDLLLSLTDPEHLQAELDTYWVQYGGADPVAWCRKLSDRLPLIHLKDYMIDAKDGPLFTDVGAGNLNMPSIVAAADTSGCEWFIVERDPSPGDPFDSLQASYNYLKKHIAEG